MDKQELENRVLNPGLNNKITVNGKNFTREDKVLNLIDQLDEPEKPEIPQFVAKEIPSEPTEALDRYYNPGVYIVPPYSYKVIDWIEGHFGIFLQALVNGFEIQKQPAWVVRINKKTYFCRFSDKYFEENSDEPTYSESGNPELVKKLYK
ncbi:DUF1642 domain-containing protein [Tetragenococcus muriaticus]|nr:DUF1642 domain-containing protein [Tetragenococcus muriaticus]